MADTIEATERDLMAQTLRRLAEQFDGEHLSKALTDFGFGQLLEMRSGILEVAEAIRGYYGRSTGPADAHCRLKERSMERRSGNPSICGAGKRLLSSFVIGK